ncbi:MAG: hypothetical protein DMF58_01110 [Acidobacteria bacterium]|nr:MAG: hypothetical protein DMF58_01110 [Acidobacteriota bacterium]
MARRLFAVARALIVAPLFVSLWMYFVPRWIAGAQAFNNPRALGWIVVAIGAAIGLPCVWEFAWRGLGTPAPFDLYFGMCLVLIGEAIVFPNITLLMLGLTAALFLFVTAFVIVYEEPTLRRTFGTDYEAYCRAVRRWIPRLRPWYSAAHLE